MSRKEEREVDDGFGTIGIKCEREDCDLHVVRPGKFQCQCNGAEDYADLTDYESPHTADIVDLMGQLIEAQSEIKRHHELIAWMREELEWALGWAEMDQACTHPHLEKVRSRLNREVGA